MTTEGVRVSWTSTDVRKYGVEIGTAFNVKTTTTTTSTRVRWRKYLPLKLFPNFTENMTRGLSLQMVFNLLFPETLLLGQQYNIGEKPTVIMCVCVFFPFILDIKFVGRTSRGHAGGRSHRISHPPFCSACLNFSREKDSAIPFPSSTVKSNFAY